MVTPSPPYQTRPLRTEDDAEQETVNLLEARRIAAAQLAFLNLLIEQEKGAMMKQALVELVKARRIELGLTQVQFAAKGGISLSLVTMLETGRRCYVTAPDVEGLARALDLPEAEVWAAIPAERNGARFIPLRAPAGRTG